MKTILNLLIIGLFAVQSINAQSISEWRQDNRTGVSSETNLLESWPDTGPPLLWSNMDLPKGFSSVSIGEKAVFVTGMVGDSDVLVALDTLGVIKWQVPYGRAWNGSYPDTRCTPTVEGDKVYLSSGFGDLACVDANTGQLIWTVKASEIYKGSYELWGIAESLVIDGEILYFTPGGAETTTIALDKKNGELIWKSPSLNDEPGYVSPLLFEYSGKKYLVNLSARYVFAVDVSDGSIAWQFEHHSANSEKTIEIWPDAPKIKCVTPLYHEGKIFFTGGYNHGSFMLVLSEAGDGVSVLWTDTILDVHHGGVVFIDGFIYGANWINNGDGNWCCLDWETGEKKYEEHWKCKGSIISAEGMLYLYDEKRGNLGLLKASPDNFEIISSFRISEGSGPYWAHPVIQNGRLYIRHGNALMAYNISRN